MKVNVTTTSTSLKDLLETAGINIQNIDTYRIKENNNGYGVYIEVPAAGADVYIENLSTATTTLGKAISASESFALDVRDIANLNLIVASSTQDVIILIT